MKPSPLGSAALAMVAALAVVACSFKPTRGGTETAYFTLKYERPTTGQVKFTYKATRKHHLMQFCASLLRHKQGLLLGRNSGYVAGTPQHCVATPEGTLMPGDTRTFSFDFPKGNWIGDERGDMPGIEFKAVYEAPPDWETREFVIDF